LNHFKQRILAEAGACRHGELGELLRREKLYGSQLTAWREERENARLRKKLAITIWHH